MKRLWVWLIHVGLTWFHLAGFNRQSQQKKGLEKGLFSGNTAKVDWRGQRGNETKEVSQISGTLRNRTIKLSGWERAFSLKQMEDWPQEWHRSSAGLPHHHKCRGHMSSRCICLTPGFSGTGLYPRAEGATPPSHGAQKLRPPHRKPGGQCIEAKRSILDLKFWKNFPR